VTRQVRARRHRDGRLAWRRSGLTPRYEKKPDGRGRREHSDRRQRPPATSAWRFGDRTGGRVRLAHSSVDLCERGLDVDARLRARRRDLRQTLQQRAFGWIGVEPLGDVRDFVGRAFTGDEARERVPIRDGFRCAWRVSSVVGHALSTRRKTYTLMRIMASI